MTFTCFQRKNKIQQLEQEVERTNLQIQDGEVQIEKLVVGRDETVKFLRLFP
jgi:hypothetical protein